MRAGGVRRLELAGERPELGWDRDRSNRRAGSPVSGCLQSAICCPCCSACSCACTSGTSLWYTHNMQIPECCRYSRGPKPKDFDGQRALDFVLGASSLVLVIE